MTNYFTKLFHVIMISTQLGCVAANFDHPFDGASGFLTNQFLGQLARSVPKSSITVRVGTVEYKNGDTIEIKGTKSNVDYPAELTIVNNSGINLNLTAGTQKTIISGTNASNFTATNPSLFTLIPGNSTSFTVNFKTNVLGDKVAEVSIPNDDLTNSNFKLNLKGVFEPKETWVLGPSMTVSRYSHTMNLLRNGKILISGGYNATDRELNSSEIFDPTTITYSLSGVLNSKRYNHSATLLSDGRILIIGGLNGSTILSNSEIFNPNTNSFVSSGSTSVGRIYHTATLLQNGKVLIAGGASCSCVNSPISSAELYDPNTGTFSTVGSMSVPRQNHTASLLPNGRVLIVGGNSGGASLSSSEFFDPSTNSFSSSASMTIGRIGHMASEIFNGNILIVGGSQLVGGQGDGTNVVEILNTNNISFSRTNNLATGRSSLSSVNHIFSIKDSRILILGSGSVASSEIYYISSSSFESVGNFLSAGNSNPLTPFAAIKLNDGRIFLTGRSENNGSSKSEFFYP
jgi:hypothetical protein